MKVTFVHWNGEEARARAGKLGDVDVRIVFDARNSGSLLSDLKRRPSAAIVIDLTRLPSQGRDLALALRESKSTRSIPVVFVGGERDKVARIQKLIPEAIYASWRGVRGALNRATSRPRIEPAASHRMAAYAGKSLADKLGVRAGSKVAMPGAPRGFEATLGVSRAQGRRDLTLWFVRSRAKLERDIQRMSRYAEGGRLWIVWPKKSGPLAGDLEPSVVRRAAESAGLVDFKIASIDDAWSGLRFTLKKHR